MRDLRVLILPHRASGSGMASYTIHLANALAQSGMNVTLLGFQDKTFLDALSPLVNFKSLGIDKTFTDWLGGPYISYKIIRYLIQKQIAYLDINDFDVLHYVYPEAVVRKANSPTIISTSWGFSSIPEIIGDAHLKFSPRWQVPGMIAELEFYLLDKNGYCKSDGVVATTTASMVYWQKQCNTRFNYIPVPLKLENRTPVINRNYTNDMISFFIGERDLARPRNNVYIAIRACKLLHKEGITDFNLHLIGRYDRRLQETVNKLKSEGIKIYLHQYMSHVEFQRAMTNFDVMLCPRFIKDQGGYANLESMAMGIPVVAPAIPAFQDVIIDNHNGLFFDGFDSADLAVKMRFLIENPSQLSRLSTFCREYIESNHSYDVSGPKVIDFYQHVLNES